MSHGHGHAVGHDEHEPLEGRNKMIALLISVIALFLAFSETLGKSAQTAALNHQIEASNLWNFFQAKNIRRTTTIVAGEALAAELAEAPEGPRKAALVKQLDEWKKTSARYRSEPEAGGGKGEGTVELAKRAIEEQHLRDTQLAKYHHFEVASAAFQIGIVLASATVITGMILLTYAAAFLGIMGVVFTAIGLLAPHAVHLF